MEMDSKQQYKPVILHYEVYVPELYDSELSPIIFLHGTAATHGTWNRVSTKIAEKTKRKVYIPDLRNHGQSEWTEENSIYHLKADIENFLSENKISKCILVGHSLGGKLAMFLSLLKPELVEKIVAEDIILSNPSDNDVKTALDLIESGKKIIKLQLGFNEVDIRTFLAKMIVQKKYAEQRAIAFCTPLRKKNDGTFEFDFNIDAIEKTFRDKSAFYIDLTQCQKFDGPVLMIYSEGVNFNVNEDEKVKEFFPNAELCKLNTRVHVLHSDKPDDFIRYVSDFINCK